MKNILRLGSPNTENCNNNDFYSYLQKNDLAYTCCINHIILTRRQNLRAEIRENRPLTARDVKIRDNY